MSDVELQIEESLASHLMENNRPSYRSVNRNEMSTERPRITGERVIIDAFLTDVAMIYNMYIYYRENRVGGSLELTKHRSCYLRLREMNQVQSAAKVYMYIPTEFRISDSAR